MTKTRKDELKEIRDSLHDYELVEMYWEMVENNFSKKDPCGKLAQLEEDVDLAIGNLTDFVKKAMTDDKKHRD